MAKQPDGFPSIMASLKAGQFAPVYFLQGEESYFIDQISDYIEKHALLEADRSFNQTIVYGKDVDVATVLNHAKRFPMMSERQLVLVKEAQEIRDFEKEVKNKVQGKEISFFPMESYLKNPTTSTILVFCYKGKTLDGRKSLGKAMSQLAVYYTAGKVYEDKVPGIIRQMVQERGHEIEPRAELLLTSSLGNNLSRISTEIDKVLVNFKGKAKITEDHIQQYVGINKEFTAFELCTSLGLKDAYKANEIALYFTSNPKEHPLTLTISILFGYFMDLMRLQAASVTSDEEAGRVLGKHPFICKPILMASKRFTFDKLGRIVSYIREADARSKGVDAGGMTHGEILRELIFKVLH